MDRGFDWSFRNHVEPVLAKQGCNSGACHGALAGKGGFRLSLRGLRPGGRLLQHRQAGPGPARRAGRPRAEPVPRQALRGDRPQGGRAVLDRLARIPDPVRWIAAGAPRRRATTRRRVERLEVLPERSLQHVGQSQQILVRAHYSDGRAEDVTRWVKWSSADESVCRVDDQGKAQVIGPGEGSVVAWFASKLAIARITVPYGDGLRPVEGGRRPAEAEELHRRAGRQATGEAQPARLARLRRRRVPPPSHRRHDRPAPLGRRDPGLPRRPLGERSATP